MELKHLNKRRLALQLVCSVVCLTCFALQVRTKKPQKYCSDQNSLALAQAQESLAKYFSKKTSTVTAIVKKDGLQPPEMTFCPGFKQESPFQSRK